MQEIPKITGHWEVACVAGLLALLSPAAAFAQFTYTTNNNTIIITSYDCSSSTAVVPNTINGLPVASIGTAAFGECFTINSVVISNGVGSIGSGAFYVCPNLTSVVIPTSVTSVGNEAFAGDTNTVVTVYGSGTSIPFAMFDQCAGLTSVVISNGVTGIGSGAFYFCPNLLRVAVPTSVTSVESEAFAGDTNTVVTIYGSGTSIPFAMFDQCAGLTSVVISNGITDVGSGAFYECPNLLNMAIPTSVTSVGSQAFFTDTNMVVTIYGSGTSMPFAMFDGCAGLTSVIISNGVTGIGEGAFYVCPNLASVTIPSSVTSIGDLAFQSVTNLVSITIPAGVTSIGDAFNNDTKLTSVWFLGNAPNTDPNAFFNDSAYAYYLPGTTGWGAMIGGIPTVLWNPQAQNFTVQSNQFGFTITGPSNLIIVVQATTNLVNPTWCAIGTNTLTGGSSFFSDPQSANFTSRFYRFTPP